MRGWTGFAYVLTFTLALLVGGVGVAWAQTQTQTQATLPNYVVTLQQGSFSSTITPLQGTQAATDFYNYTNFQSNTGLEVNDRSLIFLYQNGSSGLSLVVIHGKGGGTTGGSVTFNITGLPQGFTYQVQDDKDDQYTTDAAKGTTTAVQNWQTGFSDGFAIGLGNDPGEFTITLSPSFVSGITEWAALTGDRNNPNTVTLPSLVEPLVLRGRVQQGGGPAGGTVASFTFSPDSPGAGIAVQFNGQPSSTAPGHRIVKYEWDFNGDGAFETTSTSPTAQYTFPNTGTFRVTLRVTDDGGTISSTSKSVNVIEVQARSVRNISTPQASPGSTFRVTLEIQMGLPVNGLGVQEKLPPGFEIVPVDNGGATFKRAESQWIFADLIATNEVRRIVYDVHVNPDAAVGPLPYCFDITGFIESASPGFLTNTTGQSHVCLTSCLDIPVAIAHLTAQDVVDLRLDEKITMDQLQRAASFWLEEAGVPGTCNAVITFEGLKQVVAYNLSLTPIDEALPNNMSQSLAVTRTILTPLPFGSVYLPTDAGRIFRVKLDVVVNQDTMGAGVKEVLPLNWTIKAVDSAGAVFKQSDREWVFTDKLTAGSTKSIMYQVTVPDSETPGQVTLWGKNEAFIPRFEVSTPGDGQVVMTSCLDTLLAVSHLDVVKNDVDVTLANLIQFDQIQTALADWLEDVPVPGTCGKTIDFETMKLLIAHWLTDTPVDQPLPGGAVTPPAK